MRPESEADPRARTLRSDRNARPPLHTPMRMIRNKLQARESNDKRTEHSQQQDIAQALNP